MAVAVVVVIVAVVVVEAATAVCRDICFADAMNSRFMADWDAISE